LNKIQKKERRNTFHISSTLSEEGDEVSLRKIVLEFRERKGAKKMIENVCFN